MLHFRFLSAAIFLAWVTVSANADPQPETGAGAADAGDLDSSPEAAVRQFMAAAAEGNADMIERAILPHPYAAVLFRNDKRPPVDAEQFAKVPLKRLKLGDTVAV